MTSLEPPPDEAQSPWWSVAVIGAAAVVLLLATADDPRALPGVGVPLAVFVAVWLPLGRRADHGGRGWLVVLVVLVGVCFAGSLASPWFATMQVVAFPIAWSLSPGLRAALAANVAVAAAVGIGYAAHAGPGAAVVAETLSLAFSLAMGLWISSIERRSQRRQDLVERLTAAQEQIAALNREAGTVVERERLARELHDTLAQSLTGIVMLAERARLRHPDDPQLTVLEESAREALGETRSLVAAGAPVPLDGGLAGAMAALAGRFARETGLAVTALVEVDVPRGLEVVLLRCAQEGLANVRKHARATRVALQVVEQHDQAVLSVTDDGVGPGSGDGFGIVGMRDRIALVGGDLTLRPAGVSGSVLEVRVPLERVGT